MMYKVFHLYSFNPICQIILFARCQNLISNFVKKANRAILYLFLDEIPVLRKHAYKRQGSTNEFVSIRKLILPSFLQV